MEHGEAAAVERARAGSPDAFRTLVEQYSRSVFRVAYRMTGNEHDAEDIVQETFLRAYRQLGGFDGRAKFSTWLTRIAVNCALDHLRARQRRGDPVELDEERAKSTSQASPEQLAFSGEIRNRLAAALKRLTPVERAAFIMRHYEGAPVEEIARVLAKPNAAARHCIFRAVQKLRDALEPFAAAAQPYGRQADEASQ